MNILIVANHYAVCSARYAADAFTRLGHDVKHVGRPMGRDIWGMQVPAEYVWEPTDFNTASVPMNGLIVAMDSDPAILDWSAQLVSTGKAPIIVWGVDNHVRDYRRPYFDHYFLAHKSVSVMDWTMRADMTWLPCAYDPIAFPPSPVVWAERQYDVCMIGVMYPKRWELVNAMRAAGLKVLAGTGLVYDAYRDAHHNSRVALVSSFNGDLPIRLFEGAGMGCAVLSDPIEDLGRPEMQLFDYDPVHFYHSVEEAVELAKTMQHPPQGEDDLYTFDSLDWAKSHTWDMRAQVIIDWLEGRK